MNGSGERLIVDHRCYHPQVLFDGATGLDDSVDLIRSFPLAGLKRDLRQGANMRRQGATRELLAFLEVEIHIVLRVGKKAGRCVKKPVSGLVSRECVSLGRIGGRWPEFRWDRLPGQSIRICQAVFLHTPSSDAPPGHTAGMTGHDDKPRIHDDLLPPISEMATEEITRVVDDHGTWLRTAGKEGARAVLFHCDLRKGRLNRAVLRDADLSMCDLREVDLGFADLREATLQGSDLLRSNLRYANLERANLVSTHLVSADMTGATLRHACLMDAKLQDADFTEANLEGADFWFAEFERAKLHGTKLVGTDLRRWYLDEDQLEGACGAKTTKLLDGVKFRLCSDPTEIVLWKDNGRKLMALRDGELVEL